MSNITSNTTYINEVGKLLNKTFDKIVLFNSTKAEELNIVEYLYKNDFSNVNFALKDLVKLSTNNNMNVSNNSVIASPKIIPNYNANITDTTKQRLIESFDDVYNSSIKDLQHCVQSLKGLDHINEYIYKACNNTITYIDERFNLLVDTKNTIKANVYNVVKKYLLEILENTEELKNPKITKNSSVDIQYIPQNLTGFRKENKKISSSEVLDLQNKLKIVEQKLDGLQTINNNFADYFKHNSFRIFNDTSREYEALNKHYDPSVTDLEISKTLLPTFSLFHNKHSSINAEELNEYKTMIEKSFKVKMNEANVQKAAREKIINKNLIENKINQSIDIIKKSTAIYEFAKADINHCFNSLKAEYINFYIFNACNDTVENADKKTIKYLETNLANLKDQTSTAISYYFFAAINASLQLSLATYVRVSFEAIEVQFIDIQNDIASLKDSQKILKGTKSTYNELNKAIYEIFIDLLDSFKKVGGSFKIDKPDTKSPFSYKIDFEALHEDLIQFRDEKISDRYFNSIFNKDFLYKPLNISSLVVTKLNQIANALTVKDLVDVTVQKEVDKIILHNVCSEEASKVRKPGLVFDSIEIEIKNVCKDEPIVVGKEMREEIEKVPYNGTEEDQMLYTYKFSLQEDNSTLVLDFNE